MKLKARKTLLNSLLTLSESGKLRYSKAVDATSAAALGDLLQLLHLVHPIRGGIEVEGETARLFVRSLAAHLADNVPMALEWESRLKDATAANGTRLLAAVELTRKDTVSNPTPVREIFAVNAIIKTKHAGVDSLLMQFDDHARQFQLIGGKREPTDVDSAHTLIREIQEELEMPNLRSPGDFTLVPIGERFEQITLSPSYGVVTSYHISFFHVTDMRFRPQTDADTQWISVEHVRSGRLPDGRKVSDLAIQSLGGYIDELGESFHDS